MGSTIFAEMSALAVATGSVNLGQGFPDTDGPREVAEAAAAAILGGRGNQYPPGPGIPELRQAVADHQQRFYGLGFDPDTEVLVTAGATEAIAAALLARRAGRRGHRVTGQVAVDHFGMPASDQPFDLPDGVEASARDDNRTAPAPDRPRRSAPRPALSPSALRGL